MFIRRRAPHPAPPDEALDDAPPEPTPKSDQTCSPIGSGTSFPNFLIFLSISMGFLDFVIFGCQGTSPGRGPNSSL